MVRAESTRATTLDWAVVGAGLLAYVSSFFPWHRTHVSVLGAERFTNADNAWNAGFGAWFSVLLLVAAGVVMLAGTVGVRLPVSRPLITLGLSALAFITILLQWATFPDASGRQGDLDNVDVDGLFAVSSGAGIGLYLGLTAAIVAGIASFIASTRVARSGRS